MASTPARNISYPDPTSGYNPPVDWANTANSVENALVESANYGVGTTAEMNAAVNRFPDGAMWYNTTNDTEYRRVAGIWVAQAGLVQETFEGSDVWSPSGGTTTNKAIAVLTGNSVSVLLDISNIYISSGSVNQTIGTLKAPFRPAYYFTSILGVSSSQTYSALVSSGSGEVSIRVSSASMSGGRVMFSGSWPVSEGS